MAWLTSSRRPKAPAPSCGEFSGPGPPKLAVKPLAVVHLPVFDDNGYQPMLLAALQRKGVQVIHGGQGRFLRTALFRWRRRGPLPLAAHPRALARLVAVPGGLRSFSVGGFPFCDWRGSGSCGPYTTSATTTTSTRAGGAFSPDSSST